MIQPHTESTEANPDCRHPDGVRPPSVARRLAATAETVVLRQNESLPQYVERRRLQRNKWGQTTFVCRSNWGKKMWSVPIYSFRRDK